MKKKLTAILFALILIAALALTCTVSVAAQEQPASGTVTVECAYASLRRGPGENYPAAAIARGGEVYQVRASFSRDGKVWYEVEYTDGTYLWLQSDLSLFTPAAPATTTSTTTKATTTTTKTTTAATTTKPSSTTSATATTTTTTTTTTAKTTEATTTAKTTTTTTAPTTAATTAAPSIETGMVDASISYAEINISSINLRVGPGTGYAKACVVKKGEKFILLGSGRDANGSLWYNIACDERSLWGYASYFSISKVSNTVEYVDPDGYPESSRPCHLTRLLTITPDVTFIYQSANFNTPLRPVYGGEVYEAIGTRSGSDGYSWFKINVDGVEGYITRKKLTITNDFVTIPDRDFSNRPPVIYLSPSRQGANPYKVGDTSEQEQMEALGAIIAEKLEAYDCIVIVAEPALTLSERAVDAYEKGADIYLALHSNATGNATVKYGPSAYYFPACAQSKLLAEKLVEHLNLVAPFGQNLEKQVIDGMVFTSNYGYAEVREPGTYGMISLLLETEFHDYAPTAQWIIDNKEIMAQACVDALADAFGLRLLEVSPTDAE